MLVVVLQLPARKVIKKSLDIFHTAKNNDHPFRITSYTSEYLTPNELVAHDTLAPWSEHLGRNTLVGTHQSEHRSRNTAMR